MAKRLGRGLSALIPDYNAMTETMADLSTLRDVPVMNITQNKYQPRLLFKDDTLHELSESIRSNGLIQPIIVRSLSEGKYELISGERRFRAVKELGYETIPAIIKGEVSDQKSMLLALIENIQREDINAIEQALAYKRILEHHQLTQQELAEKVGKSRSTIANTLRLLELSESVKKGIIDGLVSEGHARVLLRYTPSDQDNLLAKIIEQNLSVRSTESLTLHKVAEPSPSPKARNSFETPLGTSFNTQVFRKGQKGRVVVHFTNDVEFQSIIKRLK